MYIILWWRFKISNDLSCMYFTTHFVILPCFCLLFCFSIVNIFKCTYMYSIQNNTTMQKRRIQLLLIMFFGFLLSVVTAPIPCNKRRYVWNGIIVDKTVNSLKMLPGIEFTRLFFCLYRSNCCAGYMLETNKRMCVGKYHIYFNTIYFMKW